MRVVSLSYPFAEGFGDHGSRVIAIGEFDGMHLGHQQVIQRALERARSLDVSAAIMTFHPHPREVLGQARYACYLTPLEDKLRLLAGMGVDTTYVVEFNVAFSRISPELFIRDVLEPLRPETVVVGFDFAFGHRGAGSPDTLCDLGRGRFAVEVVRPVLIDGSKVGSTCIRENLETGDLAQANQLLGRSYSIRGTVVHGEARGRTIGFPTANIEPMASYVMPAIGVYAVRVRMGNGIYPGVANIGMKPTFRSDLPVPVIEAHLFDYSGDIYGKSVELEFEAFLRAERKFPSLEELIAQIRQDADTARQILQPWKP